MRVFVTGATGFVGTAVVRELLQHGHQVAGLARSDASARKLQEAGAEARRGSLDDLDSLYSGASTSDGVIHLAFIHDFSDYANAAKADQRAIETMGDALAGSDRPLVVTSGFASLPTHRPATEDDAADPESFRFSEAASQGCADRGVRASVVRLAASVHGEGDHGFVPMLIGIARERGVAAYVGEGANRWPGVHRVDAARLFRLALEQAPAGARLHAAADEGVPMREIAQVIGRGLGVPVRAIPADRAEAHFGWLGAFVGMDMPASSALTQQRYGWRPGQPGLIEDLSAGHYFA